VQAMARRRRGDGSAPRADAATTTMERHVDATAQCFHLPFMRRRGAGRKSAGRKRQYSTASDIHPTPSSRFCAAQAGDIVAVSLPDSDV